MHTWRGAGETRPSRSPFMSLTKNSSDFSLAHCLVSGNINTVSRLSTPPAHLACLSVSFVSIKVPLNPLPRSRNVNVEQKECIQVHASGVWGYSAEISHWRKVNMVGVMRLEPD